MGWIILRVHSSSSLACCALTLLGMEWIFSTRWLWASPWDTCFGWWHVGQKLPWAFLNRCLLGRFQPMLWEHLPFAARGMYLRKLFLLSFFRPEEKTQTSLKLAIPSSSQGEASPAEINQIVDHPPNCECGKNDYFYKPQKSGWGLLCSILTAEACLIHSLIKYRS